MESNQEFKFNDNVWGIPLLIIFLLWFIYWVEIQFNFNFNKLGIYPRSFKGLRGIFFSPLIHSDIKHLFNNSVPLFLFSATLFYFYEKVSFKTLFIGAFLTGIITWGIGRSSYHIGASGVVYMLFSFIFLSGILRKHFRLVAMSLLTILLYGSMVWYIFPIQEKMSWEGHLSGLFIGIILAILFRKQGVVKQKYEFIKTDFDDMFDEDGNYVPPILNQEDVQDEELQPLAESLKENFRPITYKYIYVTSDQEE